MSTVAPGDIRAQLPASPPEQAEPFSAVLADLDRVLMPGHHALESPALLRLLRDHGLAAGHPRRAADGDAERQRHALAHVARGDRARAADALVDRASCSDCPETWHGHIEDSASTSTLAALCAARTARPDRRVVVASEHAHSSIDRACRILGLEMRHAPVDDAFRMRVDGLDLSDACAVVAAVGTTSTTSVDPVPEIADCGGAPRRLAAHRRRLQRLGARLPRAAHAGLRARRLGRRQSAQMALHAGRLLLPLHVARPTTCARRSRSRPSTCARRSRASLNLNEYGPALGRRFRALKLWAVLRCFGRAGPAGDDPRARAPGRAVRGLGARRARLGALRPAAVLGRVLPARGRRCAQRGPARGGQRQRRGLPLAHAPERPARAAPRHRQRARRPRTTCALAWQVLQREAARLGAGAPAGV